MPRLPALCLGQQPHEMAERGDHATLLAAEGLYARLAREQAGAVVIQSAARRYNAVAGKKRDIWRNQSVAENIVLF